MEFQLCDVLYLFLFFLTKCLQNSLMLKISIENRHSFLFFFFFFCLFAFSRAAPAAHGGSQARGLIGPVATGLRQSHSNAGSELRLRPTPQVMAMPDP